MTIKKTSAVKNHLKPVAKSNVANTPAAPTTTPKQKASAKPETSTAVVKQHQVVDLLQRKNGATLSELQKLLGWQPHSVRGFLSGVIKKRLGHSLQSEKANGERRYSIVKG